MLNKIDKIPWGSLKHAYGFADDVPDQIRGLASSDPKVRENSLWSLYGNIFHQGTRYQATPYAIPFLFELIENETIQERENLIYLLVSIALGYENEYLPEGVNIAKFQLEYETAMENMTLEQSLENKEYGYSLEALLDCYFDVENGVPILQKFIPHENKLIIRAAIYALAWFPEKARSSIKLILEQIKYFEDEKDIANAILAIGLLRRSSNITIEIQELKEYFSSSSELIKVSTAICFAKGSLENETVDILIQGILSNNQIDQVEDLHFNEGDISGFASLVLSKYGESQKEKIMPALCEVLKSVNAYQSLGITASIIEIINRNRTIPIIETKVEELDPLEIFALTAIAKFGGWEGFGNYSLLMSESGMPNSKEKLLDYLNKEQ